MDRRRFITLSGATLCCCAGCAKSPQEPTATVSRTTRLQSNSPSPREHPNRIYISARSGSPGAPGSNTEPIESIKEGFNRAGPGDELFLRPGHYYENATTVRNGEPEKPITLRGQSEAIVHGTLGIKHSHIKVEGLSFDGLQNPDKPEDPASYARMNVNVNWFEFEDGEPVFPGYIRDITIKPSTVGNTLGGMIGFTYTNNVEVGEFEVIGPAGLKHKLEVNRGHNGEIVYIGTPFAKWTTTVTHREGTPIPPPLNIEDHPLDRSRNYHVHHIKHTAGHDHAELVDVKAGASDVTIEYCTDAGGAGHYRLTPDSSPGSESAVNIHGSDVTLRWCSISNSEGAGVSVGRNNPEFMEEVPNAGRENAIYGNEVLNSKAPAFLFETQNGEFGPADQRHFCGNDYSGQTEGDPDKSCPDSVPGGEGIGHLGGDSPWA